MVLRRKTVCYADLEEGFKYLKLPPKQIGSKSVFDCLLSMGKLHRAQNPNRQGMDLF